MDFVHLNVHSDYSILKGYSTIKEYIEKTKKNNQNILALTDFNSLSGIYDFLNECHKNKIKPICGMIVMTSPNDNTKEHSKVSYDSTRRNIIDKGAGLHLTLLAKNKIGLYNLFKILWIANQQENFFEYPRVNLSILEKYKEGIIVLSGDIDSEINIRFRLNQDERAYEYAKQLKSIFNDDFYIEIMPYKNIEGYSQRKLIKLAKELNIKAVLTNDVYYSEANMSDMHEKFLAIGDKSSLSETPSYKGGTRKAIEGNDRNLKSFDEMNQIAPYSKLKELYDTTVEIANKVEDYEMEYNSHLRPKIDVPKDFNSSLDYLKHLVNEGFKKKRGNADKSVKEESKRRLKIELERIVANDFVDYILVVWDYCKWSEEHGYLIGSGRGCFLANSKVSISNNNTKNIEDIKIGDEVIVKSNRLEKVLDTKKYYVDKENCVKIYLNNFQTIECTEDHNILTLNGYVKAKNLTCDHVLVSINPDNPTPFCVRVIQIEHFKYTGVVYDLETIEHNYQVSGVVVHNSAGGSELTYLIGIHKTDPIRYDLMFDRFISEGRGATLKITYEDDSEEVLNIAEKKKVNGIEKYIHELNVGDEIEED